MKRDKQTRQSRVNARSDQTPKPKKESTTLTKGKAAADRILAAAFKSIARHGCGTVTLRGIADEAGVALSQLNYYYGNKDSLFTAVLKRMQHDYVESLDKWLGDRDSLQEKIIALVEYHESILERNPDLYRNFLEFFNFAMNSKPFQAEVASFTAENAAMIESHIVPYCAVSKSTHTYSQGEVVRYILSASFGIALQHFLSPENVDVRKGFDIIKTTAVHIVGRVPVRRGKR